MIKLKDILSESANYNPKDFGTVQPMNGSRMPI